MSERAVVVCGAAEARCHCGLSPGHDGPHECADRERCGGSWTHDENGEFVVVRLPLLNDVATEAPPLPMTDPLMFALRAMGPFSVPRGPIVFGPDPK